MMWFHRLIQGHTIRWGPFGFTYNEATCSCGKRWIK